jgi:protein-S-isoprenylcysteine O-methyltransferase Ste14
MFPILTFVYYRLSKREEYEMIELFGDEYMGYMEKTPMFIPKLKKRR